MDLRAGAQKASPNITTASLYSSIAGYADKSSSPEPYFIVSVITRCKDLLTGATHWQYTASSWWESVGWVRVKGYG